MPTKKKSTRKSIYSPHPSLDWGRNVVAKMAENTGRTLEQWIAVAVKGPADERARRDWLKSEHGLGTNHAAWICDRSLGKGEDLLDDDAYLAQAEQHVEKLFSGPKAALRPIYERLLELAFALGTDVRVSPCATMVPIFRSHAIAQIKPSTRTRVDFGLALGKHKGRLPKRLVDTGGAAKKDRITHKIELSELAQIDDEVARWLRTAYELDA